jgi:hypothetical protein
VKKHPDVQQQEIQHLYGKCTYEDI